MVVATSSDWIRRYSSPLKPRIRLLCLPHAGGAATFFHGWARAFGNDIEVLAACYPGRQHRINEPCLPSIEAMADALTEEMLAYADAPLAIFGHSMGATLAYEITLRLHRQHDIVPTALLLSSREPPHRVTPINADPDDQASVVAEVHRLGGTDSEVLADPDLRDLVLPAIRSDFRLVNDYAARPGVPLPCPVVGYVGSSDPDLDDGVMRDWGDLAPEGFDLVTLQGDHFYLVDREEELTADIRARLRTTPLG
ncbi:thioesterase II family protein [Streptomyces sp. QL37]|uniref:thioesterase II family protein n=1 Tax=Streptomyces sp. QL37 TaxID=2093747 RepID=UPI000CF1D3D5|nr:alpha/beta fold hydrolase [Streptomyces sp. QL37]PPQ60226.1 thioesterase [Streptomyces sp. QL37]